ncbi:hypothetical protein CUJ83_09420 [Methanocella sp. CWC-04]|uniref:Uncharacterized protein n=1 Tax=Methanooceanicella nereidis TaxID=2052831 RepID=A0AAP2RCV5_9EURY|nr:hypothetical protein [Methanocella sp. CWC-04]MCD1295216.1 hypothetical protein [Methanocella sp. CWC-04]
MTDAAFLSDRGNVFDEYFKEQGYVCNQIGPHAFGSPFCQPCKLLIIPSGFADPKYYKVLPALDRNVEKIREFIENGGVLLVFGAMLTDYTYDWLPMNLSYHMHFKNKNVRLVKPDSPAALLKEPGMLDCDGYFTESDGDIVMELEDGKPVVVEKSIGKGYVIASALHEYPDRRFLDWACGKDRVTRTI